MTMNLLQDWCKELEVDIHRALLITGIPERLQQADIEATLRPKLEPLGNYRLRTVRAVTKEKAQAALVEFGADFDHSAIPIHIRGENGIWKIQSKDRGQDARVLRQMRRLLLDERPMDDFREIAIPLVLEAQAQAKGLGKEAKKAGSSGGAARNRRGRRGGKRRSRSHKFTVQKGKKRGRGGRRARSESDDSSDDSLGIVIEEIYAEDLSVDEDQRALYATLQAAAKELTPPPNWAEAMGLLLGAVVQVIFYMDAEIRNREEETRAEEAELMATWASTAMRKVKKEPGLGVEVGSAFKTEDQNYWRNAGDRGDPPKPLVRRAGGKIRSRRRKQKKNPKQEPIYWRKPQGNNYNNKAYLESAEPAAAQGSETPDSVKSNKKPFVKQEETFWKKKRVWKDPNELSQSTLPTAESPGSLEDSDGGPESPPKKKAMTWASNRIPAPMRKKRKMSMGSLSYVLVDSEATKNKPVIPKKGPTSRRAMSAQRAPGGTQPADATASTSRARKTKPGGFPGVSNSEWIENDLVKVGMQGGEPRGSQDPSALGDVFTRSQVMVSE
ncbi:uncharacterized protein LOC100762167 isoform X1 [Cricetulus griseus]|uniref:uncharacterized protein LOC100762167 isoform X1 n=1 Tax=Cricetulus griseus TaxID=10029 RepID=UPI000454BD55|nr:uncharacterized protein LOC100762167 isoform X1 [Cricetulus griseus]